MVFGVNVYLTEHHVVSMKSWKKMTKIWFPGWMWDSMKWVWCLSDVSCCCLCCSCFCFQELQWGKAAYDCIYYCIYSRTAQLRLYSRGRFTALRISWVAIFLEENNSHVNLPDGGRFVSGCPSGREEAWSFKFQLQEFVSHWEILSRWVKVPWCNNTENTDVKAVISARKLLRFLAVNGSCRLHPLTLYLGQSRLQIDWQRSSVSSVLSDGSGNARLRSWFHR